MEWKGLSIVKLALARPKTIVFAGARDPDGSKEFHELTQRHPGRFFPVKLLSADKESNEKVASLIKATVGQLDVVIANAGKSMLLCLVFSV
jgi:NAD(P)-dependent dehydrogenase (short-subunit alcohol dehydrogenase family)